MNVKVNTCTHFFKEDEKRNIFAKQCLAIQQGN